MNGLLSEICEPSSLTSTFFQEPVGSSTTARIPYPPTRTLHHPTTHPYLPVPTRTHPYPPVPTRTHPYPPVPTHTHPYPPIPTCPPKPSKKCISLHYISILEWCNAIGKTNRQTNRQCNLQTQKL